MLGHDQVPLSLSVQPRSSMVGVAGDVPNAQKGGLVLTKFSTGD